VAGVAKGKAFGGSSRGTINLPHLPAHELREIQSMVGDSRQRFLEAWNEFFGIVGE
jgi:hypothetical protein